MRRFLQKILPRSMRSSTVTIPVVRLSGAIMPGSGQLRQSLSLASTAGLLEKLFGYNDAPAVAISINSPGGSAVQSRLIYRRIRDLAAEKNKTVLIFVEDVAASGGYWLATAGDEIYADESSILGSIGVVSASFGFTDLLQRAGIERRVHTAGERKVMLDPFRAERPEDVARLKELQKEIHDNFKAQVRERRGSRLKGEDADLFSGEIWGARRALALGLIDGIGDLRSVLRGRFGEKVRMILVGPRRGWLRRRLGLEVPDAWAEEAMAAIEARALWARYGL